ncbi:recombination protein NinG [Burkholderia multivorans]|uniref:recombination protein NinG n=1 Tax=Burkholderia multivorans TaxID=87883 RepID=UPI001C221266|nr:recombination protein NinG [Burkholderia multivorans]
MNRILKPKRCRICAREFAPISSMSKVCSVPCSLQYARNQARQKGEREIRAARQKAKSRSEHLADLQDAFNAWIRMRDAGQPCISCGRMHKGRWHAGHYRSVGSAPELRFEPLNVHLQCAPCNLYLSGNLTAYRINLIEKIGLEKVEWLEGKHEPLKLTLQQIEQMKSYFRAEVRRMKRDAA